MEILTYKINSEVVLNNASSMVSHTTPGIVGRMVEFFSLTKEERLRAGIYVGSEGREWIEQSAIVLPDRLFLLSPRIDQD
jgi:hypothetical protein